MHKQKSSIRMLLASTLLVSAIACSPVVHTRGNLVDNDRLAAITPGISQKADVTSVLGTPTTIAPFGDDIWYYMGEKTANTAFFEREITERRVLAIQFDENDTVLNIEEVDQTGVEDIEAVDAATPTAGKKMNMFQQFLSNLGKFNTNRATRTGADL